MKFIGGFSYRFIKPSGVTFDYVFAGDNGADTLWRAADNVLIAGRDAFMGTVEIIEIDAPDRAANEVR